MPIRLKKLEIWEVKIPFRFTFKHALAERNTAHNLILALHTECGHIGYGEILPRPYLTGETIESAWGDLRNLLWPEIKKLEFMPGKLPFKELREVYLLADRSRKNAAYSGIDIALVDAWARASKIMGSQLFSELFPRGEDKKKISFTCPVGGGGKNSVRWISRIAKWVGYHDFKLKVGRTDDPIRLKEAKRVIGDTRDLRVDANAAWTFEQAMAIAPLLKELKISSVEQPFPADQLAEMAKFQEETGIAVMADESLCTLDDAKKLIQMNAAKIWNLRLAKVGGFTGFAELFQLAHANNIKVHQGVLVGETPILTAAARAALTMGSFLHAEYGFPWILLKDNIVCGGPGGNWGVGRYLGSRLGLGVTLKMNKLKKYCIHYECFD